jgi:hypothetical protein
MENPPITVALTVDQWAEWDRYISSRGVRMDPARDAKIALETLARNNDILPPGSPFQITHKTVHDLREAAKCLDDAGHSSAAESTRETAAMLVAILRPLP